MVNETTRSNAQVGLVTRIVTLDCVRSKLRDVGIELRVIFSICGFNGSSFQKRRERERENI